MTTPTHEQEYAAVDWHGECLHFDQDAQGIVTISRPPFETVFNDQEMIEITQFINEYRSRPHTPTPTLPDEVCRICEDCRVKHDTAIRNAALDDFALWVKTEWVQGSIKDYKEEIRTTQQEQP